VDWDVFDFSVAGILLAGAGLAFGLASRKVTPEHRAVVAVAVVAALLLVWAELAVGVFGTPLAGG
jgi:hypothetical protein